ncbi:MAG: hypothetical protein JEZ06_09540 [Anaerolineaceae bacterium]|nr:hypothetical protein [Anaerolineaceae bacterium]
MKNNSKLGAILSIFGILTSVLFFYFIASQYNPVIDAHIVIGRLDEATSVSIVFAVLGWLGISAGAIWAVATYGFLNKEKWAWFLGVIASTIQLLAGFFPAIPAMDGDLSTPTLIVFGLAAILWFGMLLIGNVDKKIITLSFIVGLAYVLTFIVGVAPISKYVSSKGIDPFWNGMYVMTQQVSWWGAAAWAFFIFALVGKKSWAIPLGVFAGSLSMLAGYPLGIHNAFFEAHRFSMFLPGPLMSTALVIYLLLPGTKNMIEKWNAS